MASDERNHKLRNRWIKSRRDNKSKKKQSVMDAEREVFLHGNKEDYEKGKDKDFVPGCVANGVDEEAAVIIWDKMAKFAEYAFNKSHSAAYAYISVRTAWLKYYYAPVYWAETMNGILSKTDKLKKYMSCARKSCRIIPPDVNKSDLLLNADNSTGEIHIGLSGLRDIGKFADVICSDRAENGEYSDFADFLIRLRPGKKVLESLAYSGALDSFGVTRSSVINSVEALVDYGTRASSRNSCADFDELNRLYNAEIRKEPMPIQVCDEFEISDILELEKKYTGLYLTAHPLDEYADVIKTMASCHKIAEYLPNDSDGDDENIETVKMKPQKIRTTLIGVVETAERKITKNGNEMYVGTLEDDTGTMRFVIFPDTMGRLRTTAGFNPLVLVEGSVVTLSGQINTSDKFTQIVVDNASLTPKFIEIPRIPHKFEIDKARIELLRSTALACDPGHIIVVLRVRLEGNRFGNLVVDANTGVMYNVCDRTIDDPQNLAVDDVGFKKLKELSFQVF